MASTYSPDLRIELIGSGEQAGTWGNTTNTNLGTLVEDAIAGAVTVAVAATPRALTALNGAVDESRQATLTLTTTLTAAFTVLAPPVTKQYVIFNNTAYIATIGNATVLNGTTPTGGATVDIPAGRVMAVWSDGTNIAQQNTHLNSPSFTTPALGTPSSGVITNLTGTASININGTVGATTPAAASVTVLTASADSAFTSTGAVQLSSGTTGQRPTGAAGKLRFNSTTSQFEGYNGATWASVGGGLAPAFSAYLSVNQTITTGTTTKVAFNTEQFDTNSNYDNATNYRFTPTVAGYYQINVALDGADVSTGVQDVLLRLYKNGAQYLAPMRRQTGAGAEVGITLPQLVYCNGTDYLEVYLQVVAGTNFVLYATSNFSGSQARSA